MARVFSSSFSFSSFSRRHSSSPLFFPSFLFSPFSTSKSFSSLTRYPFISSSSSSLSRVSSRNENSLQRGGHLHIHPALARLLHSHSSSSLSLNKEKKKKDSRERVKDGSRSSQSFSLLSHKRAVLPVYYVSNLDEAKVALDWIYQHAHRKISSSLSDSLDGFPPLRRLSDIHLTGDLHSLLYNPPQSSSPSSFLSSSSFGIPGVDYSDIFDGENSTVSSSSSLDGAIGIYVPLSFSRRLSSSSSSVSASSPPSDFSSSTSASVSAEKVLFFPPLERPARLTHISSPLGSSHESEGKSKEDDGDYLQHMLFQSGRLGWLSCLYVATRQAIFLFSFFPISSSSSSSPPSSASSPLLPSPDMSSSFSSCVSSSLSFSSSSSPSSPKLHIDFVRYVGLSLFSSPDLLKVIHGSYHLLSTLYWTYGVRDFARILDTQVGLGCLLDRRNLDVQFFSLSTSLKLVLSPYLLSQIQSHLSLYSIPKEKSVEEKKRQREAIKDTHVFVGGGEEEEKRLGEKISETEEKAEDRKEGCEGREEKRKREIAKAEGKEGEEVEKERKMRNKEKEEEEKKQGEERESRWNRGDDRKAMGESPLIDQRENILDLSSSSLCHGHSDADLKHRLSLEDHQDRSSLSSSSFSSPFSFASSSSSFPSSFSLAEEREGKKKRRRETAKLQPHDPQVQDLFMSYLLLPLSFEICRSLQDRDGNSIQLKSSSTVCLYPYLNPSFSTPPYQASSLSSSSLSSSSLCSSLPLGDGHERDKEEDEREADIEGRRKLRRREGGNEKKKHLSHLFSSSACEEEKEYQGVRLISIPSPKTRVKALLLHKESDVYFFGLNLGSLIGIAVGPNIRRQFADQHVGDISDCSVVGRSACNRFLFLERLGGENLVLDMKLQKVVSLPSSSSPPLLSHSEESPLHTDHRMYEEARKRDLLSGFSLSRPKDQDLQDEGEKERKEEEESHFLQIMRRVHDGRGYDQEKRSLSSPFYQKLTSNESLVKMRNESAVVLGLQELDKKARMETREKPRIGEKIHKRGKRGAVKIRKKLPKNRFDDDGKNS